MLLLLLLLLLLKGMHALLAMWTLRWNMPLLRLLDAGLLYVLQVLLLLWLKWELLVVKGRCGAALRCDAW